MKKLVLGLAAILWSTSAAAQWQVPLNNIPFGRGVGTGFSSAAAAANSVLATNGSNVPGLTTTLPTAVQDNITRVGTLVAGSIPTSLLSGALACANFPAVTGDITITAGSCASTLTTVNANVGTFGSATNCTSFTVNAKGLVTAASHSTCAPLATSIASPAALTDVDDTNVTITLGGTPATALLRAVSITAGWTGTLSMARGGSAASLTASAGGIVWTDANSMEVLAGTATAGQMLRSGASATPAWSTTTWPATTAQGDVLYASAANVVGALAKDTNATRALCNTGTSNAPAWCQVSLSTGVTGDLPLSNIVQVATASFLGRTTASTGDIEVLTVAQATALLNNFVGDSGAGGTKGLVPAPASGDAAANKFLKADGTWTAPSGAGDVSGPASSIDNAAARYDSTSGKILQGSALVIADTTGDLSRSGGGGIDVQGTNTNDAAAVGEKGEYVESLIPVGSAVTVSTGGSGNNITSISLTAGDWDISTNVWLDYVGGTVTILESGWHTTSATLPTRGQGKSAFVFGSFVGAMPSAVTSPVRLSISATTTVYLIATLSFSGGGTNKLYGSIHARRVR